MTKVPALAAALLVGLSTAALAGAATQNARETWQAEGSGSSAPPSANIYYQVRDRLAADGYGYVSDVRQDLGGYTARAVKDGKVMEVLVDPETGDVHRLR